MFKRFKNKKGAVAVMAAIITVSILGFTALAVDVGIVMVGRNQLQNAVDSASLAAASKLDSDVVDHAVVINTAKEYASYNKVLNQPVVLQDWGIQIFDNEDKALRRVKITASHTINLMFARFLGWNLAGVNVSSMGNPLNLMFFVGALGYSSVDVTASSMAGLIPIKASDGIRPWAVRDKCHSGGNGDQDQNQNNNDDQNNNQNDNEDGNENNNQNDNCNENQNQNQNDNINDNENENDDENNNENNNQNENGNDNENNNENDNQNENENANDNENSNSNENENEDDINNENSDDNEAGCTSYEYPAVGELVTLKFGPQDDTEEPHWFAPVDMPPVNKGTPQTGADAYRDLIENGYNGTVEIGDVIRIEPGNMAGPTEQGVNYLIGQDPSAYWDSNTKEVMGSSYPNNQSSRIIKVVFYDPNIGVVGSPGEITVTRIGAFFLEGATGPPDSRVTGRFIETVSSGELDVNSQSRVFGIGLTE